jgi:hypothetical protein
MALPVSPSNEIRNRFKGIHAEAQAKGLASFLETVYRGVDPSDREKIAKAVFDKIREKYEKDFFSEDEFEIE